MNSTPTPSRFPTTHRRRFLTTLAGITGGSLLNSPSAPAAESKRKMTINLVGGAIGVSANQRGLIDLAAKHEFESVEAVPSDLARLSDEASSELVASLKSRNLAWGAAGLPVEFRKDEETFRQGMKGLPGLMAALQRAGVTRVSTWLKPYHETLTYHQNFKQHVQRLKEIATVLADHDQRFGLEYVGTFTLWSRTRYSFVHSMAETKDLIGAIGADNIGFVLDSWHWWTADETPEDIRSLTNDDIVAVDLNDAPVDIPKREQLDNQRELPGATGVIDLASFLNALQSIGYDGPVRAEPFNQALNRLDNDEACSQTSKALRRAFGKIKS
ncbi:MAG: sugar phosphate isomerase/epimerase family protein [Verrucomicrobiota bacterium]